MQGLKGFYGNFGGQFVPETLIPALDELESAFVRFKNDSALADEFCRLLNTYAGRPTPVYFAKNMSNKHGFELYIKREDLLHTGAHKINNTIGQGLLARAMGKKRIIAETGAGQHGVASATAAALLGLECTVYMGSIDAARQALNVKKMNLLGAKIELVDEGAKTLKDAVRAAMRDWVTNIKGTHYLLGSALGPYPFPEIVAYFQSVIGRESREHFNRLGFLPDSIVACVGGGSNSIGMFREFLNDDIDLVGVEAGGRGIKAGDHAARFTAGEHGIFQGSYSYVIQHRCQIGDVHSVSAGLDYPGVGPEHAHLKETGRVRYESASDRDALRAFDELTRLEGIMPALESSHAVAWVMDNSAGLKGKRVLLNMSGRGDKDLGIIINETGASL
jgi:tryptophan synthase beta chain